VSSFPPIAIVGVGGILPGAADLDGFWELVREGRSAAHEVPAGRWVLDPAQVWDSQRGLPDKVVSRRACLLRDATLHLDGLAIPDALLAALDPMVLLALHAGNDAWSGAATRQLDRQRVGVVLGNIALPTESTSAMAEWILGRRFERDLFDQAGCPVPFETRRPVAPVNRWVTGLPAGVLARGLGLGGGHLTLDAACSSSFFALHLAIEELVANRADAMLAGGLSRPDSLYTQMGFSQLQALSPSGECRPFDKAGDGLVVGEGAGVFLLKRLEDAREHGDEIHAVIRGVGLSNDVDGRLLAPSEEGQLRALRAAYARAGWKPTDVDLIECHATGTPVGDGVELASLTELWGASGWESGQCTIGSVKSNVGHLLTGAGAAGLLKVLGALRHRVLPPTAGLSRPIAGLMQCGETAQALDPGAAFHSAGDSLQGASPFVVRTAAAPWERRAPGVPRRAALSGFGFGGTNAHVLIEEYLPPENSHERAHRQPEVRATASPGVAVIGLGAQIGPWSDASQLSRRLAGGRDDVQPARKKHFGGLEDVPSGYFIDELAIPVGRFRIPPKEIEETLPQQLVMLSAADEALRSRSGSGADPLKTGVFIGLGLDLSTSDYHLRWSLRQRAPGWAAQLAPELSGEELQEWIDDLCEQVGPALNANRTMGNLGGIVASRVAREFGLGGPCFVLGSEESSGFSALAAAVRALQRGELDEALVGAVDLTGDVRSWLVTDAVRGFARDGESRPLDCHAAGPVCGEGAVALLLRRSDDARAAGDTVMAEIVGLGEATGGAADALQPNEACVRAAMERALSDAGVKAEQVGFVATHGSGVPAEDGVEARALAAVYGERRPSLTGAAAAVGHAGAASALVSLVSAVGALRSRLLPPLLGQREGRHELAGFGRPTTPRYWLDDGVRHAALTSLSSTGHCGHVVLREAAEVRLAPAPLGPRPEGLFLVEADGDDDLRIGLNRLARHALSCRAEDIDQLARAWHDRERRRPEAARAVAIVAREWNELERLARLAATSSLDREELAAASEGRVHSATDPLAVGGGVAFVFPGSGCHYPGMGRELGVWWPELLARAESTSPRLAEQIRPGLSWDGSQEEQDTSVLDLMLAQTSLGVVASDVLRHHGVRPDAVLGYSLGETAGFMALGVWNERELMLDRVLGSNLFTTELTGPCHAAHRAWNLADDQVVDWLLGVVDRPAAVVREALADIPRAYLLIVNTLDECVVGGDGEAVRRLVEVLQAQFQPLQGVTTVHCPVVREVGSAYRDLHLLPTAAVEGVRFYSGASCKSYPVDQESAAEAITAQALDGVDFPTTVRQAWEDGARVFVELGPGRSCTRMIRSILDGERFVATALCTRNDDGVGAVLSVLGRLLAERATVDLSPLYGEPGSRDGSAEKSTPETPGVSDAACIVVPVGTEARQARLPLRSQVATAVVEESRWLEPDVLPMEPDQAGAFEAGGVRTNAPSWIETSTSSANAHASYLRLSAQVNELIAQELEQQLTLTRALTVAGGTQAAGTVLAPAARPAGGSGLRGDRSATVTTGTFFDRAQCLQFAVGTVRELLGEAFRSVDEHPTRVRLPDEPLMLVDRILSVEGEALSMGSGRVVTEHDVLPDAWYLEAGRIPTCVAVEAGQADLFLSGWLGIDLETRGLAVYRLLDAVVTFHDELPAVGETIRYDIRIDHFFRQGDTWLFRFGFEASVNGRRLMTMEDGCAGFFTQAELDAGQGIVRRVLDDHPDPRALPDDWRPLVPMEPCALDDGQMDALRAGDLQGAFGPAFAGLPIRRPLTVPGGGDSLMRLVHRVLALEPKGGRYGIGSIRAEADIHPDDWFLTCHFVDDQVMPGTLMYECCLHTLRVFLLRMGWVVEADAVVPMPVQGVQSRLRCRGQVLASTRRVTYDVTLKELGYEPEPYAIVDALMFADGKPIVEIGDMSLRLAGARREDIEALWAGRNASGERAATAAEARGPGVLGAVYDDKSILAFSDGEPSAAFGAAYRPFDSDGSRRIARLPRPPYQFLDRITAVKGEPFVMRAGAHCEAQFDLTPEAWFFGAGRQRRLPFAVLLEVLLQPCGWLAAYVGSALTAKTDLRFRNLGGEGEVLASIEAGFDVLTTRVSLTGVAPAGGMIIQQYSMEMISERLGPVYAGTTSFGFFSAEALTQQVGLGDVVLPRPEPMPRASPVPLPRQAPFPGSGWRMLDRVDVYLPRGGPAGLGWLEGSIDVDPSAWFFKAHFRDDPVWPGSLGLEALLQLMAVAAADRWDVAEFAAVPVGARHRWTYRGQVAPSASRVEVAGWITSVDEVRRVLTASGVLSVDGRPIYSMEDFALEAVV